RKGKVVYPVHVRRNLDLPTIVRVNLNQHRNPEPARRGGQVGDELEGLRYHEAAAAGALDRIAHGIEPDHSNTALAELAQNGFEVGPALWMPHVDIRLIRGECRPEVTLLAGLQRDGAEGQAGTRPIDRSEFLLIRTVGKYCIARQEQAGVRRSRAAPDKVAKLR